MTKTVTPAEFDAEEFRVIIERDRAVARIAALQEQAHVLAGDRKEGSFGAKHWTLTNAQAEARIKELGEAGDRKAAGVFREIADLRQLTGMLNGRIESMEDIYRAAPWSRYFPCQNADGHIHSSLRGCKTVYWDTDMGWETEMSGRTVDEAIHGGEGFEGLGETLCSVCFPEAPAEWCRTKRETTRAQREAEKAARAEAKFVKGLRPHEVFRASTGDRIETVAAAKAVFRKPYETAVELEYERTPAGAARWSEPESNARCIAYMEEKLVGETADAQRAHEILLAREEAAPGTGWTQADADRAAASAAKRTRKAYFG